MEDKRMTDMVPVYDVRGELLNVIRLPEKIMPIPAKRGGFGTSGIYYKGCGVVYRNHLGNEISQKEKDGLKIIGNTGIVYEKYLHCYQRLVGKFGIFMFRHQPVFSDYEGGCGKKEQRLIENQDLFRRSAIEEIVDVIPTGIPQHNIYGYRLKNVKGGIEDTVALIQYVLENNWNTAWDKNLWGDIMAYGYIRDVADWFISEKINHKLGTVYALLNSLYRADLLLYSQVLLKSFGVYSFEKNKILYYSALMVRKYCREQMEKEGLEIEEWNEKLYKVLFMLLISGKACCHLEEDEKWSWVREYYAEMYSGKNGK